MEAILVSVVLILIIVGWGYRELVVNQNKTKGLTTWMFACPPFLGVLGGIWFNAYLVAWIKIILILMLLFAGWATLFFLYKNSSKGKIGAGHQ